MFGNNVADYVYMAVIKCKLCHESDSVAGMVIMLVDVFWFISTRLANL